MTNLTDSDLRDPAPPVPGDAQRAAVAARAHQLGRKRRMMQGVGALGMVAAVAVGVAALTAGGTSGSGTSRIEAASSSGATETTDAVVTTTVPAPVTTVPAPTVPAPTVTEPAAAETETPAPPIVTTPAPVAPSTFAVSGTVSNIPPGATLTLSLSGSGGTFSTVADGAGNYTIVGVPAGEYQAMYEWVDSTGTATQVGRVDGVVISGDTAFSFSL